MVGEGVEDRRDWAETCGREAAIRELLNQYPATLEGWGGRRCYVGTWGKPGDSVSVHHALSDDAHRRRTARAGQGTSCRNPVP